VFQKQLDGPNGQPTQEGLDGLHDVIIALPDANKILLKELCRFLRRVTKLSDTNKMTTHNISIGMVMTNFFFALQLINSDLFCSLVFGPNLIRPKEETIETSLELPRGMWKRSLVRIDHWYSLFRFLVNLSFKIIIEYWSTLFDEAATPRPSNSTSSTSISSVDGAVDNTPQE